MLCVIAGIHQVEIRQAIERQLLGYDERPEIQAGDVIAGIVEDSRCRTSGHGRMAVNRPFAWLGASWSPSRSFCRPG